MANVVHLTPETFEDVVLKSEVPAFVDFWASWCMPCKAVEPILPTLAKEYEGKATIAKLQVDQYPGLRDKYKIQGVPTFLVFVDGEAKAREVGALPPDRLRDLLDGAFEPTSAP